MEPSILEPVALRFPSTIGQLADATLKPSAYNSIASNELLRSRFKGFHAARATSGGMVLNPPISF